MLPFRRTGQQLIKVQSPSRWRNVLPSALSAIAQTPRYQPPNRPTHPLNTPRIPPYLSRRATLPNSIPWRHPMMAPRMFAPASTWAQMQYPPISLVLQNHSFHSTRRVEVPYILVLLKSSYTLSAIQFIGRVTMSLIPFLFIKGRFSAILMNNINVEENPELAGQYTQYANRIRQLHKTTWVLLALPFVFLGLTVLASSERTPLTGRWRVILLSPAEEEAIAQDLKGDKWFDAVGEILAESNGGTIPSVLSRDDWRWRWVESTFRRLETAVKILHDEEEYRTAYEAHLSNNADRESLPFLPPPPAYPLIPRPRATALLHEIPLTTDEDHAVDPDLAHDQKHHIPPHTLLGPPYSLLIVNKDESNAFSYGFGPDGGGGVVVFSGFLDDILAPAPGNTAGPGSSSQVSPRPFWSSLANSLAGRPSAPPQPKLPNPTPQQTSQLAVLLAHELSHLILSHHIETLSSGTILFPIVVSICVDTVRTILYPFTFLFGPFVADALDSSLRVGVDEVTKAGESCTSRKLEIEADLVSTRLLALAGFDPRDAVTFWEERMKTSGSEDSGGGRVAPATFWKNSPTHGVLPDDAKRFTHPISQERVLRLRQELEQWEKEMVRVWEKAQSLRISEESPNRLTA